MRLSSYLLPLLKELPADASIVSHVLMLRAGLIAQNGSGLYTILPFGLKVLQKIEKIIQEEFDKDNAQRLLMPIIQDADLWVRSGRFDVYGPELLRIKDRHDKNMVFSPTNEECIVELFERYVKSYKQLPLCLYQIHWKFRDEIRPRFGLLRAREFLMMDAYSFHINEKSATESYYKHYGTYMRIFLRMGLRVLPMLADVGQIGGQYTHEFHVLADSGESDIYYDSNLNNFLTEIVNEYTSVNKFDNRFINEFQNFYAATDEKYNEELVPKNINLIKRKGIEVGQIFYLGNKYTNNFNVKVVDQNNAPIIPEMCTYGIGLTRLLAAFIESNHDEKGIVWNKNITPFDVQLINLDHKNQEIADYVNNLYQALVESGVDVLYDDTTKSVGEKLTIADLIGIPVQIIIGTKHFSNNQCEIKIRKTNKTVIVDKSINAILSIIK